MNTHPKTIQIFLPSGDPLGIRVAEITTRIVQVIEVPQNRLGVFLKMDESGQVAVYFLLGTSEENAERQVYTGQTGDLRARLVKHSKEKNFWDRALVIISRTNSLTQTHALFLEWHCIQAIRAAGRYSDMNGNKGTKPHTPAPLAADCLEIFETAHTLLAMLGYPVFDAFAPSAGNASEGEIFCCSRSGTNGRGTLTSEGFVVLKGSTGRRENMASNKGKSVGAMRDKLIKSGVMLEKGDQVLFAKDWLFQTPSGAAATLLGSSANGWIEWKNDAGKSLDEVKRQTAD